MIAVYFAESEHPRQDARILLAYGLKQRGLDYSGLSIENGAHGKPYIAGSCMPFFNISHSGARAACAIADTEVGIDIERIRDKEPGDSLIRKVCTETEREYLQGITSKTLQKEQFYKLWTVKECVMKQCGMGLAMAPDTIEADKIFEQDQFLYQGMMIRTRREQDYFLSVCGAAGEETIFRQVDIEKLKAAAV